MPKRILTVLFGDPKFTQPLRNLLGFTPGNLNLYKLAFRHKSAAKTVKGDHKNSNERLEYLGDAVLGAVVAEYLFKKFPFKDEGFLTEMRSKIVSRTNLNKLSKKLGLPDLLEVNGSGYAGRSADGDALEALIGAVFLDHGFDKTRSFILNRLVKLHLDIESLLATETNFKSRLIEWAQRERKQVSFELTDEVNNGRSKLLRVLVSVNGEPVATGLDFTRKRAEQVAAEATCKKLSVL